MFVWGSSPLARGLHASGGPGGDGRGIIPARAGFTRVEVVGVVAQTDHPRSRGVYAPGRCWFNHRWGSSPLARGLPDTDLKDRFKARIIPARAGFTRRRPGRNRRGRGSSPLARGLHRSQFDVRVGRGIIPARAGFTRAAGPPGPVRRDHPRSRGVYSRPTAGPITIRGSSPLARGLRRPGGDRLVPDGIIPARAGFTTGRPVSPTTTRDHPRSRGVYSDSPSTTPATSGSSPLARGLRGHDRDDVGGRGIIPARAGFTPTRRRRRRRRRDHPRSRGVYQSMIPRVASPPGSSPLARGLPPHPGDVPQGHGIIPARAGFTEGYDKLAEAAGDHPRSRGVYRWSRCRAGAHLGSSPLARGLQNITAQLASNNGIIPARAGFTVRRGAGGRGAEDHPRSRGVYPRVDPYGDAAHGSSPLARGLPPV